MASAADMRAQLIAGASFEGLEVTGADLAGLDLSHKEFFQVKFVNCRLQETVWSRARLEACTFRGCDLTRAKPAGASPLGVTFSDCKLMGVEFTRLSAAAQLGFEDCLLRYATFLSVNLRAARFTRCRLTEASFVGCDLTTATFDGCDLTSSVVERCELRGADFSGASGVFLDPARTTVRGVKVAVDAAVRLAVSLGMVVEGSTR